MNTDVRNYISERCSKLIDMPNCCPEAKDAAKNWLSSVGTEAETEATNALMKELEEDIITVDQLIAFGKSDVAIKHFGEEKAAAIVKQGEDAKAAGIKHCTCPACECAFEIVSKKSELM